MDPKFRIDNNLSLANHISNDRRIIQHDVIDALIMKQDAHAAAMNAPGPFPSMDWAQMERAHKILHRAHKHQPGEAGASTWGHDTIVTRKPE